jgi:hypothetical protein
MYHTLQEFTAQAKETGYIVAGLVLLGYVFFWYFLVKKKARK